MLDKKFRIGTAIKNSNCMTYAERPNYTKHVSYHVKNMSNDSVIFRLGAATL